MICEKIQKGGTSHEAIRNITGREKIEELLREQTEMALI